MKLRRKMLLLQQQPYANTETSAWIARVIAAGSSVSTASATAHDAFITSAKSSGFWSLLSRLNTYGANTLAGALVPLLNTAGNATDTNNNFVGGNFSLAGGLTGDGTKFLDTGAQPSSFASQGSFHGGVIVLSNASTNGGEMGVGSSGNQFHLLVDYGGTSYFDSFDQGAGRTTGSPSSTAGFFMGVRSGVSTATIYRNASVIGSSSNSISSTPPSSSVTVFGNGIVPLSSATMGGYSLGVALNSTQVTAYYAALQTLMTALGRTIPV